MKALLTLSLLAGLSAQALADSPASRLDEVLQRGEMSVCTTGDYKPYSYSVQDRLIMVSISHAYSWSAFHVAASYPLPAGRCRAP